jgi:hypothetical protein
MSAVLSIQPHCLSENHLHQIKYQDQPFFPQNNLSEIITLKNIQNSGSYYQDIVSVYLTWATEILGSQYDLVTQPAPGYAAAAWCVRYRAAVRRTATGGCQKSIEKDAC